MKKRILTGIDGEQVTQLIPESEEDLEEIKRLEEEKAIDTAESFGDVEDESDEMLAELGLI